MRSASHKQRTLPPHTPEPVAPLGCPAAGALCLFRLVGLRRAQAPALIRPKGLSQELAVSSAECRHRHRRRHARPPRLSPGLTLLPQGRQVRCTPSVLHPCRMRCCAMGLCFAPELHALVHPCCRASVPKQACRRACCSAGNARRPPLLTYRRLPGHVLSQGGAAAGCGRLAPGCRVPAGLAGRFPWHLPRRCLRGGGIHSPLQRRATISQLPVLEGKQKGPGYCR